MTFPFPEFHHALLVARWAEMTPFAGKCQEVFVAAVEITIDHLLDIWPPEAVLP